MDKTETDCNYGFWNLLALANSFLSVFLLFETIVVMLAGGIIFVWYIDVIYFAIDKLFVTFLSNEGRVISKFE